ncbi:MAG: RNA polymerase II, partial [Paramarteilia canceri]
QLFPQCLDLIVIMDDLPSVWSYLDNVLCMKPFSFFEKYFNNLKEGRETTNKSKYLPSCINILLKIHSNYFQKFDENIQTSTQQVMSELKRLSLQNCMILCENSNFGNEKIKNMSHALQSLGARSIDVTELDNNSLKRTKIKIVSHDWLYLCIYYLNHVDEKKFIVSLLDPCTENSFEIEDKSNFNCPEPALKKIKDEDLDNDLLEQLIDEAEDTSTNSEKKLNSNINSSTDEYDDLDSQIPNHTDLELQILKGLANLSERKDNNVSEGSEIYGDSPGVDALQAMANDIEFNLDEESNSYSNDEDHISESNFD